MENIIIYRVVRSKLKRLLVDEEIPPDFALQSL